VRVNKVEECPVSIHRDNQMATQQQEGSERLEREECAVCCEDVDPSMLLRLPCKHCYHAPCMNRWALQHAGREVTCPQCREPVSQQLLQELQRPLSWVDMMVLPIMLIVMVLESLHGYLQTGYLHVSSWISDLAAFFQGGSSCTLEMLQVASNATHTRILVVVQVVLQLMGDTWNSIQRALTPVCCAFRDCMCAGLQKVSHVLATVSQVCANGVAFFDRACSRVASSLCSASTSVCKLSDAALDIFLDISTRVACHSSQMAARMSCFIQRGILSVWGRFVEYACTVLGKMLYAWTVGLDELGHVSTTAAKSLKALCAAGWQPLVAAAQHFYNALSVAMRCLWQSVQPTLTSISATSRRCLRAASCGILHALTIAHQGSARTWHRMQPTLTWVCASSSDHLHAALRNVRNALCSVLEQCGHASMTVVRSVKTGSTMLCAQALSASERACSHLSALSAVVQSLLPSADSFWSAILRVVAPLETCSRAVISAVKCGLNTGSAACNMAFGACHGIRRLLAPSLEKLWDQSKALMNSSLVMLHANIVLPLGQVVSYIAQLVSRCFVGCFMFLWKVVCFIASSILDILITLRMTAHNVVYHPRCSVCERGCAKVRSLCFTCVGDHLVPRCSDCGKGWCKLQSRCLSCIVDHHFQSPRCGECAQGFKKIGPNCFTCALDKVCSRCAVCQQGYSKLGGSRCFTCLCRPMIDYWRAPPRCVVCSRGYQKVGTSCFTCLADHAWNRCTTCQRGYAKVGTRCFTCFKAHVTDYPRCGVCERGYAKIGTRCFTCVKATLLTDYPKCGVCERGYAKIGTRCFTCFKTTLLTDYPRCGVCEMGYAKVGTRCFTCLKAHLTDYPRCGVCQLGYAKVGSRCFTCLKAHLADYQRCGMCQVGYAKIGQCCFKCFKAQLTSLRCGICQRGYAKVGARCLTCHFALMRGASRKVTAPDAKLLGPKRPGPLANEE